MKRSILAMALATSVVAGCGGDEQTVNRSEITKADLYFSYPMAGQAAVATTTPIFLRFTQGIATSEDELASSLQLESEHGDIVALTDAKMTAENRGVAVRPAQALLPGTRYTLVNTDLRVGGDLVTLPNGGIEFTTAPATTGPLLDRAEGTGFDLARVIPAGNDRYPATDMSSLRIQFTEPVDEQTLRYGDTIALLDGQDEAVAAQLYISGHRVTVDPDSDLDPNQTYTLHLSDDIRSMLAQASLNLSDDTPLTFQPLDSRSPKGERERMPQTATTTLGDLSLSGEGFNSVGLRSILLGQDNITRAQGTVFAELGYIPRFDANKQSVPLRIDQGTLMAGSNVDVNVAGALPAGFSSEAIEVRFLSDAEGFLMANPYTDDENAPRMIELFIDMALNTGNTIANAALAQELLHVHLIGTAIVEQGSLSIEAVGIIEPDVMGVDVASGLISFRLEGYRNPDDAPAAGNFADTQAPFIKSWVPGEEAADTLRPGDPLIIYFSEPVLPGTVNQDTVKLFGGGNELAVERSLNGSILVIKPDQPLAHGTEYSLILENIKDTAGFSLGSTTLNVNLAPTLPGTPEDQSPLVLVTMPGFPCTKTGINLSQGHQGRCAGGKTTDDLLPIPEYASHKPLVVRFSQNIRPETLAPGVNLSLEVLTEGLWEPVPAGEYDIRREPRSLIITPVAGWQPGAQYRYTLNSNEPILSASGLPLQTELLTQGTRNRNNRTFGGEALVNHFVAVAAKSQTVSLPLRNLPTADANSDLAYQKGTEQGVTGDETLPNSAGLKANGVSPLNSTSVVKNANIGCAVGLDCASDQSIYLTAMLDTLVYGKSIDNGTRIPVDIYPSILATTSSSVWVRIDTSFIDAFPDFILSVDLSPNEEIPTGPMLMRIRYDDDSEAGRIPPKGFISSDENGQLTFETVLNVYLDAPYLNPSIGPANLTHNLRSYEINNLRMRGPITFLDDGRMQISLSNIEAVPINVDVRGTIEITGQNTGGLCGIWPFTSLCGGIANVAVDANSRIHLEIPPGKLNLNYLSPYTQN
ncbi:Ig-like domain-containing protein [Marinobacter halophilus]|uniref:SbsA Ig-like domain-containing protein n=1 Tax=Marinobacter halophilus TaxID=1323740 RepID=A0A2T1KJN0_9GAMM|nr:Ig-like domain-containing protein [Marinobacter halophilus]PSF10387.1 hypothetical protein C7H08_02540 [Marinobacter halophilus]GGC70264.1 hypothetical protein GCM10011362_18520 [Marinobacter halophilus]